MSELRKRSEVIVELMARGIRLTKREGEWRVAYNLQAAKLRGVKIEESAYYTDDFEDAVATAEEMLKWFPQ